jgi:hypothetical protein
LPDRNPECRSTLYRNWGFVAWLRIVHNANNHKSLQPEAKIEISLNRLSQLFNSLDPSPFHERDLDQDAEEYIMGQPRRFGITAHFI